MKSCLYIPRLLVPRKDRPIWCAPSCDRRLSDRAFWEEETNKTEATAFRLIFPEALLGDEELYGDTVERQYNALEEDLLEKLVRGLAYVQRKTSSGVRCGVVAAIDLEAFTFETGVLSPVRAMQKTPKALAEHYARLRKNSPLEVPNAIALYRDPKDKVGKLLKNEDLEDLYSYDEKDGKIKGKFIPEDLAEEVLPLLTGKGEPNFVIAEGNAAAVGAKMHWEEVKKTVGEERARRHPARFMLAEFVNAADDAVTVCPVHRLLRETETEAFIDFFSKNIKCTRKGNLLYPALPAKWQSVQKVDALIAEFLKADLGRVCFVNGEDRLARYAAQDDGAGVVMPAIDKDDLFKDAKAGDVYPYQTFAIGKVRDGRYHLEAREISYD